MVHCGTRTLDKLFIAESLGESQTAILNSISVLIVDEENLFRDGIAKVLSAQPDFTIVGCANAAVAAVELIRKERPDICLLGWSANSAGGQKVLNVIQETNLPTRVIMLSDDGEKEDLFEAVRHGCCGIVPKQTSTELLLKSIRKVHAGEIWLDRKSTADVIRRLAKKSSAPPAAPGNSAARLRLREQGAPLSSREREIVILVAQGFKNKEMAERMFISEQTVKNHLHNIFDKLGVSDRLELALYAIHHNMHDPQQN